MIIKGLIDEDFINYKIPSMVVMFPNCTFKCDKECGQRVCQNSALAQSPDINVSPSVIVERYIDNPMTNAIVLSGLEPFDSYSDLCELVRLFREQTTDDIVIYTGYNKEELIEKGLLDELKRYKNIIVKFGRFILNRNKHIDHILGVELHSDNQYGEIISEEV